MKLSSKLGATLLLVSMTTSLACQQPSIAGGFGDFVKMFTTGISNWSDLESRFSQIDAQITQGQSKGQLTSIEATSFRNQLIKIQQSEAQLKAQGQPLSLSQSLAYTNELNALTANIGQAIDAKVAGLALASDIDGRISQLQLRMQENFKAGKISDPDFLSLQRDANDISRTANLLKARTGTISDEGIELLSDRLNRLSVRIDASVNAQELATKQIDDRRVNLSTRIDSLVASKKVSPADATDLREKLNQIYQMQNTFKASGVGLDEAQIGVLASRLDQLSNRMDQMESGQASDFDNYFSQRPTYAYGPGSRGKGNVEFRLVQIRRHINAARRANKLSNLESNLLRREYQRIDDQVQATKVPGKVTSPSQWQAITAQIDDLNQLLNQEVDTRVAGGLKY